MSVSRRGVGVAHRLAWLPSLVSEVGARPARAISAIAVAALAVPATTAAYVETQNRVNPSQVLRIRPNDPGALNAAADRLLTERLKAYQADPTPRSAPAIPVLAMRSLRARELNPGALRLLAFDAMLAGDNAKARKLAVATLQLTRREPLVYMIGIHDAAQRNDYDAIIDNYDRAFTVAAISRNGLVPSLVGALSDVKFRRAFAPRIAANPTWTGAFLRYAALNTADLPALSDLIVRAGGLPPNKEADETASALVVRMYEIRQFSALRRFVTAATSGAGLWQRTDYATPTTDARYAPATWQLLSSGDVDVGWRGEGAAKLISISTSPGEAAQIVARKLLVLSPGTYLLRYRFSDINGASDASAQAYWSVTCVTDGAPPAPSFWSGRALATIGSRPVMARVAVPIGCTMQELTLTVVGGNDRDGLSLAAAPIILKRERS